jgi:SDR family mycofactocin-dependent oxidoreductase
MGRLDGKVALITGAARGQGRSHALTFAREGADVVLVDAPGDPVSELEYELGSAEQLAAVAAEVEELGREVIAEPVDVRSQEQIDAVVAKAIERFGKVDVCVANAAIWTLGKYWELDERVWQETIDINLSGVWRAAKAVTPSMIERGGGSIVLTSSVAAFEGNYDYAHYGAAKTGVVGLMRSIALEGGPFEIRCNAVCPGVIDTPMNQWQGAYDMFAGEPGGTPQHRADNSMHWSILKGRGLIAPQSVSNAALFLASDESSDVTGVAIPVDGGHGILPGHNASPIRG